MPLSLESAFLPGPNGALFCCVYSPGNHKKDNWIIHCPPFAEEMNRCRPMVSSMARKLAQHGYSVLVPDLSGTGDSVASLSEVDLDAWHSDIDYLVSWVLAQGNSTLKLWGVRFGAQLALHAAAAHAGVVTSLLFWQPQLNSKLMITQFLRLGVATGIVQGEKRSVRDIENLLHTQGSVEVAGYTLGEALHRQLAEFPETKLDFPLPDLTLLEVGGEFNEELTRPSSALLERWRASGGEACGSSVSGAKFWQTQEIAFAPAMLEFPEWFGNPTPGELASLSFPCQDDLDGARPVRFDCESEELLGVFHGAEAVKSPGLLIVVGGPQYRVGSHRQFVDLARAAARDGIPTFRFDCRGMGDSSGIHPGFEHTGPDIEAALEAFHSQCPSMEGIVVWGLCDAATSALLNVASDRRVTGLILVNPWVQSEAGEARAYVKTYYWQKVRSLEFWRDVTAGGVDIRKSMLDFIQKIGSLMPGRKLPQVAEQTLPVKYRGIFSALQKRTLTILSGNDLTAAEFRAEVLHKLEPGVIDDELHALHPIAAADHTFSRAEWKREVERTTIDWVLQL